jgi:hypothetical protein
MDPNWGEEFYLEWAELAAGKRLLTFEVWDWDFWRPDELLGRGFININDLAFEPLEVRQKEALGWTYCVHTPVCGMSFCACNKGSCLCSTTEKSQSP